MIAKLSSLYDQMLTWLIALSLGLMLALGVVGIFLRWADIGVMWIGPVLQHLVLWQAFLGGALACGHEKHIGIDIINKYLESKTTKGFLRLRTFLDLSKIVMTVFVLCWLLKGSISFVENIYLYEEGIIAYLPQYVWAAMIPLGTVIILGRLLLLFLFQMQKIKT